jgi:hypothetical protein
VPAEACNCRFCYEDHILQLRQKSAWTSGPAQPQPGIAGF